jgi:alpha-tubulin suppressor-like RCC1 family protein
VNVSGLGTGAAAIAAGHSHTCARTSGGGVKCWGSNSWGQLGDGSGSDSLVPVDVSGLGSGATSIGVGSDQSCAVVSAGRVLCWGSNQYGQLGNDANVDSPVPVFVLASETVFANGFE